MTEAEYLYTATAIGLSRRDAMLMKISTVFEMVNIRAKNAPKSRGDKKWP